MPATSKLLLEAGFTPFRYNPIFGHPPPDGITNLIAVSEQSNADQSRHRPALCAAAELPVSRRRIVGMGRRQDGRLVRERIVRHRRAQHEGRLPGQPAGPAGSAALERAAAVVSVQPGRAECRDLPSPRRRQPDDHQPGRLLRPGQLDARPPDAAGRAALRSRLELRAGRTERHHRDVVPESGADRHRADARASMRTTTSRRASASPTTCSAPAERRSSSTGAATSRTPRTIRRTPRPTRASRSCGRSSTAAGPTPTATRWSTATC